MSSYVRHTEHFLFGLGEFQFRSNVQADTNREAVAGVLNILFGKIISESLVHRDLRSTAEEKVSCELFLEWIIYSGLLGGRGLFLVYFFGCLGVIYLLRSHLID